jgi:hypothetical protein
MTKMTTEEMKKLLGYSEVSKHKGLFTAYKGFFYTHGYDENKMAEAIVAKLGADKVKVVKTGYQWKPFVGGAPLKKQSFWSVTFEYLG